MEIKKGIILMAFIALLGVGAIKFKKGLQKIINAKEAQNSELNKSLPHGMRPGGFAQYLYRGRIDELTHFQETGLDPSCRTYFVSLRSIDVSAFKDSTMFQVTHQQIPAIPAQCTLTDEEVVNAEKDYLQACFLNNPGQTERLDEKCVQSLVALRSTITKMLLKRTPLSSIESMADLTELMYVEVNRAEVNHVEPNTKTVIDLADQILGINNGMNAASRVKTKVLINNAETMTRAKSPDQEKSWMRAEEAFTSLKRYTYPEDEDIGAIIQTRGFELTRIQKFANEILAKNPNSDRGYFFRSLAKWKANEQQDAYNDLKKAMELDPQNKSYRVVYQHLTDVGADETAYLEGLQIQIGTQDFIH